MPVLALGLPPLLLPSEMTSRYETRVWSLADDTIANIPAPAARGNNFLFASARGWLDAGRDQRLLGHAAAPLHRRLGRPTDAATLALL